MGSEGEKCPCACCGICKECRGFQKVLDLEKNEGLVVYKHTKIVEDSDGVTKSNVYIFHNTKNAEINPEDIAPVFDPHLVRCPNCRHTMRGAQKLLRDTPAFDNYVKSVCEHCQIKAQSSQPCSHCKNILTKFLAVLTKLAEMERNKMKYRDLQFMKFRPSSLKLPEMDQLFLPETLRPGTDRNVLVSDLSKKIMTEAYTTTDLDEKRVSISEKEHVVIGKDYKRSAFDHGVTKPCLMKRRTYVSERSQDDYITTKTVSQDSYLTSVCGAAKKLQPHDFGYFFPQDDIKRKPERDDLNSAELVQILKEKLQSENKRKENREKEMRAKILEEAQKRQLAQAMLQKAELKKQRIEEYYKEQSDRQLREMKQQEDIQISDVKLDEKKDKLSDDSKLLEMEKYIDVFDPEKRGIFGKQTEEEISEKDREDTTYEIGLKTGEIEIEKRTKSASENERQTIDVKVSGIEGESKEIYKKIKDPKKVKDRERIIQDKEQYETTENRKDKDKKKIKEKLVLSKDIEGVEEKEKPAAIAELADPEESTEAEKDVDDVTHPKDTDIDVTSEDTKEVKDVEKVGESKDKEIDLTHLETKELKDMEKVAQPKDQEIDTKSKDTKEVKDVEKVKESKDKEIDLKIKETKEVKDMVKGTKPKHKAEKEKITPLGKNTENVQSKNIEKSEKLNEIEVNGKSEKTQENYIIKKDENIGETIIGNLERVDKPTKIDDSGKEVKQKQDIESLQIDQTKIDENKGKTQEELDKIAKEKEMQEMLSKLAARREVPTVKPEDKAEEKTKHQEIQTNYKLETQNMEKELKLLEQLKRDEERQKKENAENIRKMKEAAEKITKAHLPNPALIAKEKALLPYKLSTANVFNNLKREKSKMENPVKILNIKGVNMRRSSYEHFLKHFSELRQMNLKSVKHMLENIKRIDIDRHAHHLHKDSKCKLCVYSDLALEVESLFRKHTEIDTEVIVGENILKKKTKPLVKKRDKVPLLYEANITMEPIERPPERQKGVSEVDMKDKESKTSFAQSFDTSGVVDYALSDRSFIEKGWTKLPTEKILRKINVYKMRPAHPEFDWFENHKSKRLIKYDTGETFAVIDEDGRGKLHYKNGRVALNYYDAEETNAQQRFVIYSTGELDERGRYHPVTVLATFDYLGNGVVYDHAGKIRLKYNQTEGIVHDRTLGPVSHWKWHSLNDPPTLQRVMIDTQMSHKDPIIMNIKAPGEVSKERQDNEEMLAIEFDNFLKEKNKKLSQKFKPFQIKIKALKINEHFSLRILDQATIYLNFRDGATSLKMNLGMLLDNHEIVDTDIAEMGEVSTSIDRLPAHTDSIEMLQHRIANAKHFEGKRIEHELRHTTVVPRHSVDLLTAAISRPLRAAFIEISASKTCG